MPRVIEVIEVEVKRGKGTDDDLVRTVMQYWTLDGKTMLAERDPELNGNIAFLNSDGYRRQLKELERRASELAGK